MIALGRLENALRQYSTLTQNDIISIHYNQKIYKLLCMEIKPDSSRNKGISIIETDLSVTFHSYFLLVTGI